MENLYELPCSISRTDELLLNNDRMGLLEHDALNIQARGDEKEKFSWLEYCSFFTVGMSMMWTWSMILQAAPYLQHRFASNVWILRNFQAYNLVVFAVTISISTACLSKTSSQISYAGRLRVALVAYVAVAMLLTLSTIEYFASSAEKYFPFVLIMVLITAVANSLSQQAAFAFVSGFNRTEYAPAIMTGEALAGLLPSVIEIISAVLFPDEYFRNDEARSETSVLTVIYFFSGIAIGASSLIAFNVLYQKSKGHTITKCEHRQNNLRKMWSKLKWPATANFLCLCISSVSPVFASKILSHVPESVAPILQRPEAFIPSAIILWNIGDLFGSVLAAFSGSLVRRPILIFILSLGRVVFIPMYLLCNIDGRGSFAGDWFYLVVVQFLFGLTHGWLSATSMSGVPAWVDEEERQDAGAFMGLSLVTGLVIGSLLGLAAAQV